MRLVALGDELNEQKDQKAQEKILKEAAKELRDLADHHGVDKDELVKAFGRKIG
jgi:hypothetical protein